MLGYWLTTHGRKVPMPVKRGVADAARRLYTERAALRYDGLSAVRSAWPTSSSSRTRRRATTAQSALFKLPARPSPPRRRGRRPDGAADAGRRGGARRGAGRRAARRCCASAAAAALAEAGFSWERLSGWLPGGMDAEAWEAVIPSMGVDGARAQPAQLRPGRHRRGGGRRGDRQDHRRRPRWPRRACSRTRCGRRTSTRRRTTGSARWAARSTSPSRTSRQLDGTLVVIDTSGSMQAPVSNRSQLQRVEVAAVMAMATAKRASRCRRRDLRPAQRARLQARAARRCSRASTGSCARSARSATRTYGHTAIARWFDPQRHRRVVIFTDDQQHDAGHVRLDHVPLIYTFNLAGYRPSALPAGERGRYTLGGFTDATFTVMEVLGGRPQRGVAVLRFSRPVHAEAMHRRVGERPSGTAQVRRIRRRIRGLGVRVPPSA